MLRKPKVMPKAKVMHVSLNLMSVIPKRRQSCKMAVKDGVGLACVLRIGAAVGIGKGKLSWSQFKMAAGVYNIKKDVPPCSPYTVWRCRREDRLPAPRCMK